MPENAERRIHVLPENGAPRPFDFLFQAAMSDSALIQGDATRVLAAIPNGVFQTTVTSPPYWSLRDYGLPGQIGLEESLDAYIESQHNRHLHARAREGQAVGTFGTLARTRACSPQSPRCWARGRRRQRRIED